MFGKKKRQAAEQRAANVVSYERLHAQLDRDAARLIADAPQTFPDGTPYPAARHLTDLANVAKFVAANAALSENFEAIIGRLMVLSLLVGHVEAEPMTVQMMQGILDLRNGLLQLGFAREERVVSAAAVDVLKFWEQSGAMAGLDASQEAERDEMIASGRLVPVRAIEGGPITGWEFA